MRRVAIALALGLAGPALADTLVAARTISARSVVQAEDLRLVAETLPDALRDPVDAVGLEARVTIYPGRPVRPGDLAPPAVVERNEIVVLLYRRGTLVIATEGRALDRAAPGERIRVMNLASRSTVSGTVLPDGQIRVGPSDALLDHLEGR